MIWANALTRTAPLVLRTEPRVAPGLGHSASIAIAGKEHGLR